MPTGVTEASTDDNSVVGLSQNTLKALQIYPGDTVLVRGKKRRDTILIALQDESLQDWRAGVNRVVRQNLHVSHGDLVSIHRCPDIQTVSQFQRNRQGTFPKLSAGQARSGAPLS